MYSGACGCVQAGTGGSHGYIGAAQYRECNLSGPGRACVCIFYNSSVRSPPNVPVFWVRCVIVTRSDRRGPGVAYQSPRLHDCYQRPGLEGRGGLGGCFSPPFPPFGAFRSCFHRSSHRRCCTRCAERGAKRRINLADIVIYHVSVLIFGFACSSCICAS